MTNKKTSNKSSKKASSSSSSSSADGIGISHPEDKLKYLEALTKSLELELAQKVENCTSATTEYETTKQQLEMTLKKLEEEKELTCSLVRDVTRQYKGMQDNLLNKILMRERKSFKS